MWRSYPSICMCHLWNCSTDSDNIRYCSPYWKLLGKSNFDSCQSNIIPVISYGDNGCGYLLWIYIIKVILYKLYTCCKVCLIELIWYIPSKRTKFAPLLHHSMQECNSIQQRRPLWLSWVIQGVLSWKHILYITNWFLCDLLALV